MIPKLIQFIYYVSLRLVRRGVLLLALSSLAIFTAQAHQQKEAYITLLFNDNSDRLEVSHRFLVHDAEHVFSQLYDTKKLDLSGDLLQDERSQAAFAAYVEAHFQLADKARQTLPLELIGFEVDGKFLWVYQETAIPATDTLNVKHTALHDLWPSQINHVNVEMRGEVRSVRLQKRDSQNWRSIALPQSTVE